MLRVLSVDFVIDACKGADELGVDFAVVGSAIFKCDDKKYFFLLH